MCDIETLRLFVNERLTAVAEDILAVFVRTIVQYQQQIDMQHRQLEFLTPQVTSDLTDFRTVCEEEKSPEQQEERRPDLLQEEPQPPLIKDEQQELIQRPEEADGSMLTTIAVQSECNNEIRETEPLASTSNEHTETQADVENCGASQQTVDVQLISSHCSESDTDYSDDWEETRVDHSHDQTHTVSDLEGQRFSWRNKLSQDLLSLRQSPSMRAHTVERTFSCTVCGKTFARKADLKRHTITHTGEKPFSCTVCGKSFNLNSNLKKHTRTHALSCILCGKNFSSSPHLKKHMEIHM